jgi:hypothetical protein
LHPRDAVLAALRSAGIDEGVRAEELGLEAFAKIAAHFRRPK